MIEKLDWTFSASKDPADIKTIKFYKDMQDKKNAYSKDDEQDLILKGYIAFLDPPKPTAKKTIETLKALGIEFKVLTGDNELVTKKICGDIGLDVKGLATGDQVENLKRTSCTITWKGLEKRKKSEFHC